MGTLFETREKVRTSRSNSAFTIVELLIVVVVIAILAAITIVTPASSVAVGIITHVIGGPAMSAGDTLDTTGLMITSGSTVYSYNDPVINSNWIWNGNPNASTSTGPAQ